MNAVSIAINGSPANLLLLDKETLLWVRSCNLFGMPLILATTKVRFF
jgi:hypothetical protein